MQYEYDVDEGAYEMDDGDEAYDGLDAYVGGEHDEDTDDGDYVPPYIGRQGVDDDDDDDDEEEEEDEEEEDLDRQLDAEDAAEAMEELANMTETGNAGHVNFAHLLETIMSDTGAESISSNGNNIRISSFSADNLNRVITLIRNTVGSVQIVPAHASANNQADSDDEEQEQEEEEELRATRRTSGRNRRSNRDKTPDWWRKTHTEPQRVGQELLMSGEFGRILPKMRNYRMGNRGQNLARLLRERMMGTRPLPKEDLCENPKPLVPNSHGTVVASYPSNVYCGQFSFDSSFYYVCCKDFNLHIYDMTAPRARNDRPGAPFHDLATGHRTTMKVHKSIRGIADGWTVTDSHLSPDNERMIYSSMGASVYMVKTLDYDATQTPISLSDPGSGRRGRVAWGWDDNDDYYIWSCRFSADGNEIIAGGRGSIYVYDLLAARRTVKIRAHNDDVNSCCWADMGSNVLISASDDTFIKVWDRRSLGSSPKPSGVLIGHTEGITNVSAKGDGRYVISNGKDQALRLWDLRKMRTNEEHEAVARRSYGLPEFDYRYADDRKQRYAAHPKDCSVMTYRGHTVMRTLIRCHFSPIESTGGSYIYSGSTDGRVHIWSVDGRLVQVLERSRTLPITFDPSGPEPNQVPHRNSYNCVRDVSWHSKEPVLLSAAWGEDISTVARHEWKGLGKLNYKLEDWVEKNDAEGRELRNIHSRMRRGLHTSRRGTIPGAFNDDDDDDDDDDE